MKVLLVLNQPPHPEGNAPSRCAVGLIRGLESHGVDVRAVAARQAFAESVEPPADLHVEVVAVTSGPGGWRGRRERLKHPRGELLVGELPARLRLAARGVDVVHLEETNTAWSDLGIAQPSLVHLHYLVRRDRLLGAPWRSQFREMLEFELAERAALRRHRFLLASSPLIATELRRRASTAQVELAPLTVDPDYYPLAPLDGPPVVGMIGTGSWAPTAAAFHRLTERVWPAIRRQVPDARLVLAGRQMSGVTAAQIGDGIELLGEVPSASEFLRSLSLLLFPLSRGSGMKVKVLESIASGLPVVTTSAGAEGIDADGGVIVEEDDDRLATAASVLLRDAGERRQRGAAGHAAFLRRYAPTPATEPVVEFYRRMAGG